MKKFTGTLLIAGLLASSVIGQDKPMMKKYRPGYLGDMFLWSDEASKRFEID